MRYEATDDFHDAEFVDVNMSGATFREVDLQGARMYGVLLGGADIDGDITGLRLNGVEVAPLIEAELNRLHPERAKLRPTTPEGMREASAAVQAMWAQTIEWVRTKDPADLSRSVNHEWSFIETLRHLLFVTDAWFGNAVLLDSGAFHPLGLPAGFITDGATFGIDIDATPTLDQVLAARAERFARLDDFLSTVTQEDLDQVRPPNPTPGCPPPASRNPTPCLQIIFNEEWTHRQFALRDLATMENS